MEGRNTRAGPVAVCLRTRDAELLDGALAQPCGVRRRKTRPPGVLSHRAQLPSLYKGADSICLTLRLANFLVRSVMMKIRLGRGNGHFLMITRSVSDADWRTHRVGGDVLEGCSPGERASRGIPDLLGLPGRRGAGTDVTAAFGARCGRMEERI